jgi:hypothetical protein
MRAPTNGRSASQRGGNGIWKPASARTRAVISAEFETIVPMASVSGTTNSSSRITIIATIARARLLHSLACIRSITCQVTTTIIVAQMIDAMNGRRIQKAATIRPPRKSTPSRVAVRSR